MKICFAASSGGHFEQLMMLKPLMDQYKSFIVTEKVPYAVNTQGVKTYYVRQVNRHEHGYWFRMLRIAFKSFYIFLKERPDVIVCTGVLATIPLCLLMKAFHRKLIYIESFAKVSSPTETGKFLYKYADVFYVQWESMKKFYPDAKYVGGIY
ncbi:MAG: PssD/Cps14F family polysaccharide biosynthesis glycosyltransferase [Lachnospiraceae bacterium]|nr:PssD/Cps14F family polysaccharide biosynthesis glycosyltransferase [Lachnospiraceae bacterium]